VLPSVPCTALIYPNLNIMQSLDEFVAQRTTRTRPTWVSTLPAEIQEVILQRTDLSSGMIARWLMEVVVPDLDNAIEHPRCTVEALRRRIDRFREVTLYE
jgi:hypothetical protein